MPHHVLLLGAGFSRNWNAPLVAKVANSLLEQVGGDAHLQAVLRRRSNNFENALSEVQQEYLHASTSVDAKARLDRMQGAIAIMFGKLNATFEPPREFEFCNDVQYSVSRFLAMFDSIFNLNQDLLLEMRYSAQILAASGTRWNGFGSPGMRPLPDPSLTGIADSHKAALVSDGAALFSDRPHLAALQNPRFEQLGHCRRQELAHDRRRQEFYDPGA
jgi:hypothetical protein